jgi:hypothetical protein
MPFSEFLAQFRACWEKLATVLSLLFFVFKVLNYLSGRGKLKSKPPRMGQMRSQFTRPTSVRWSTPTRTRFSKKWSVNDLPRP